MAQKKYSDLSGELPLGIRMVEGGKKQTKECDRILRLLTGSAIQTEEGCSLLQKGVYYFSVMLLLTLLIAVAAFAELSSGGSTGTAITEPESLKNPRFLLASLVVLFVMLISGLFFFIRQMALPLDNISAATRRMTEGQLDQLIQNSAGNEISRIAECINELALNKQEVLLYFWNHLQENSELIDKLEKKIHGHPERAPMVPLIEELFIQIKQGHNDVKSMILLYDFFDLKLEKEKMLINSQKK